MKKLTFTLRTGFAFLCIILPGPLLAIEGGYSNYIPGIYGDLALAVEPADGLSFRNDLYFYSAEGDGSVRSDGSNSVSMLIRPLTLLPSFTSPELKFSVRSTPTVRHWYWVT